MVHNLTRGLQLLEPIPFLLRSSTTLPLQIRLIHRNHVNQKLSKRNATRDKHLDEFPVAPKVSNLKFEKETFIRELMEVEGDWFNSLDASIDAMNTAANPKNKGAKMDQEVKKRPYSSREALKMYSLLRPNAPPFYKEDSLLNMEKRLNAISIGNSTVADEAKITGTIGAENATNQQNDQNRNILEHKLPAINEKAFILALEAVTQSLADDIEDLCVILQVEDLPSKTEPERFRKLVDCLLHSFSLYGHPSAVNRWITDCWPRLKILMPDNIAQLPDLVISDWLKGHLSRVKVNKGRYCKRDSGRRTRNMNEWYNLAEDFIYDDFPLPIEFVKETKGKFPLHRAGNYLKNFLLFFKYNTNTEGLTIGSIADQFQELTYELEKIGLQNWLSMDLKDLELHLPKGEFPKFKASSEDISDAKLLIKAAAKGKANLLQFEALDPHKLLNHYNYKSFEEELKESGRTPYLIDEEIEKFFNVAQAASVVSLNHKQSVELEQFVTKYGKTPIELLYEDEQQFQKSLDPIEWQHQDTNYATWKWKPPENSVYDPKQEKYVRLIEGLDPQLDVRRMRYVTLETTKMRSMSADGRVFYYRVIVAVGNGRGVFGIGVGYGNTAPSARSQASLDALKKAEFIDFDSANILTTPVHGSEYSAHVKIIPRPMGRGIQCNRRFLPLAYIIGLDNCKLSFHGSSTRWLTRMRALKRALDGIQSRRTIANSTGKKYSLLVAPGDHWVHWPDRWFIPIHRNYQMAVSAVRALRRSRCKGSIRSNVGEIVPQEVTNAPNKKMKHLHLEEMLPEQARTPTLDRAIRKSFPSLKHSSSGRSGAA